MSNGLHQYSTEALIKELEKRGYSCIESELYHKFINSTLNGQIDFDVDDCLDITQNFRVVEDWFKK